MKTLKIATIATVITLAIVALCGVATAELYPQTARVVILNEAEDLVTVETFNGHLFTFEGCEDYAVDDCVSLIMEDNGTDLVYDDAVIMARYSAWDLTNWYRGE